MFRMRAPPPAGVGSSNVTCVPCKQQPGKVKVCSRQDGGGLQGAPTAGALHAPARHRRGYQTGLLSPKPSGLHTAELHSQLPTDPRHTRPISGGGQGEPHWIHDPHDCRWSPSAQAWLGCRHQAQQTATAGDPGRCKCCGRWSRHHRRCIDSLRTSKWTTSPHPLRSAGAEEGPRVGAVAKAVAKEMLPPTAR